MAAGNGKNGSLKLALWKLDFNNRNSTQNIYPGQLPPVGYGLNAYLPGFESPISGQVVKLEPKDPQFMGIKHSLEYLAHRSGKTITPESITSGPRAITVATTSW